MCEAQTNLGTYSMTMAFHESRVVIIETGRRVVRAGLGLGELLHVPSVVSVPPDPLPPPLSIPADLRPYRK